MVWRLEYGNAVWVVERRVVGYQGCHRGWLLLFGYIVGGARGSIWLPGLGKAVTQWH